MFKYYNAISGHMEQNKIIPDSPLIDIMACMTRIFNRAYYDGSISFVHNGVFYEFELTDHENYDLKRTVQNRNKYDVKYGEFVEKPEMSGLIPMFMDRHFNGWDGSVSYNYSFGPVTSGGYPALEIEITIPRDIAKFHL